MSTHPADIGSPTPLWHHRIFFPTGSVADEKKQKSCFTARDLSMNKFLHDETLANSDFFS